MSDEEESSPAFSQDETKFVQLVDRFQLALAVTKMCARSCGVLKSNSQGITESDKSCLNICGQNVESTYDNFYTKVKGSVLSGDGANDE